MGTPTLLEAIRVPPGSKAKLTDHDPSGHLGLTDKVEGAARLATLVEELGHLHQRLWAEAKRSLLVVLQGLDAAGKDGTISHVFTNVNPQGCRVASFKRPSEVELAHDYLWRVHAVSPARGEIGIFNRSHYEDVVAVRVRKIVPEREWRPRFRQIREFERMLVEEGTTVVKVFLNVSRDEQARRLQARLDDPEKAWKFRLADLDDRALWSDYHHAYDEAISETSTEWAPWNIVPADHNWVRNLAVAELVVDTLRRLDPQIPALDPKLAAIRIA